MVPPQRYAKRDYRPCRACPMTASPQILISVGEASGDMYAARLAKAIQARTCAHLFGMGGPKMREAGVELVADASEIAVVGIIEVLHRLPAVWRAWRRLEREAVRRKPALAITVDSPGFDLGLAAAAHALDSAAIRARAGDFSFRGQDLSPGGRRREFRRTPSCGFRSCPNDARTIRRGISTGCEHPHRGASSRQPS